MRTILFIAGLFGLAITLPAQTLVPISHNSALKEATGFSPNTVEKNESCPSFEEGFYYLTAGATYTYEVEADTTDLDTLPGVYTCPGCDSFLYGEAILDDRTLTIHVDNSIQFDSTSIEVIFTNANGADTLLYNLLLRRKGQTYPLQVVDVEPNGRAVVTAETENLPGNLSCVRLLDCEDQYMGREQLYWLDGYEDGKPRLIYDASQFGGEDRICIVLCDDLAVCDTTVFGFTVAERILSLPFFDDFSYRGPYPDPSIWSNSEVFVNRSMGINPPSIGVATFDGIDKRGRPYGGGNGSADRLTSLPIDMSNESGELYLKFYAQAWGRGDRPELGDSLSVDFLDRNGKWQTQFSQPGLPSSFPRTDTLPFDLFALPIKSQFLYEGFQFRIKAKGDRQGIRDNWHVDYVWIDDNPLPFIADIAFIDEPNYILETYTSLPWRHASPVIESLLADSLHVGLWNHDNQERSVATSRAKLIERETGLTMFDVSLLNGIEQNIPNGVPVLRKYPLSGGSGFPDARTPLLSNIRASGLNVPDELRFDLTYNIDNANQLNDPGFRGIQRNDTVSRTTLFADEFAYDDGTAELGLVTGENTQVAVRYTMQVADQLQGVRIHFPHTSIDAGEQEFYLKVWIGELDDEPEYEARLTPLYVDVAYDSLQGFTTYLLRDQNGEGMALDIPAGDFYVGWEQITSCDFTRCIAIGYDLNQPRGKSAIFRETGQTWEPVPDVLISGSLMIRPVVGDEQPQPTATQQFPQAQNLVMSPNPATGQVKLHLPENHSGNWQVQIFHATGQLVSNQFVTNGYFGVEELPAGIYLVAATNKQQRYIGRLIRR